MSSLAEALGSFLAALPSSIDSAQLCEALRFPSDANSGFRGSELGTALWSGPEGLSLFDLATIDEQVVASFEGDGDRIRREVRHVLAGAISVWHSTGTDAETFSRGVENELWSSLRRTSVDCMAVGIVEGATAPAEGIRIGPGTVALQPKDDFMERAFARIWPTFSPRLPAGPYCLVVSRVSVPRAGPDSLIGPSHAWISVQEARDVIWLATGRNVRLGHGVAFEESPFPISKPSHYEPQTMGWNLLPPEPGSAKLAEFEDEIRGIATRLSQGALVTVDPIAITVRNHASNALHTADPKIVVLLAHSAIEGSLTEKSETGAMPYRFGFFCGIDTATSRSLTRAARSLTRSGTR